MPRLRRLTFALAIALFFALCMHRPASADDDATRRAKVAITIGSRRVTVGEVEDRLAAVPPYQLAMFGKTREEVVRTFVEQAIVRDLILAAGAEERGLDKELPASYLLKRARSNATMRRIHQSVTPAAVIPVDDVKKFYDENRSRFDSPERVQLWRILCKTQEEATAVLDAAKKDSSVAKWNELAREHSVDKATNLRGGNLGFVGPDGTSNEAGLKVDPVLVKAAMAVKDGELVPRPVSEGDAFAAVWRRGTVPANRRSVEEASAQIRTTLFRERIEAAEKNLIQSLRARDVKDVDVGLLGLIELPAMDAGINLPRSTPRAAGSTAKDAR